MKQPPRPPKLPKPPQPPTVHQIRKELAQKFAQHHCLSSYRNIDVRGVMVDKKDGESRVIVLMGPDTDADTLCELADMHFGDHPFKVVKLDEMPGHTSSPLPSGLSISREGSGSFGTIGGWFRMEKDRKTGQPVDQALTFGVSNNHVIGNCNNSAIGDRLTDAEGVPLGQLVDLQPLTTDGSNAIDVAVFQLDPGFQPNWNPSPPAGWTGAQINFRVYKQGARTQFREGVVTGIGSITANLCGTHYLFEDVFAIKGIDGAFSEEGDSGSIVLTSNHMMVGLLFAKAGDFAYAARIKHLGLFNLIF